MDNKKFYFGAATSSHQVEGGNLNNWTRFEKANKEKLAQKAIKKYKKLPIYKHLERQVKDPDNYVSGEGPNQYHLYKEDFSIMEKLGFNAYRFSLEWSRIEPEPGKFDKKAIRHYQKLINSLKRRKIEPFLTLWHFSLPIWFEDMGGFERAKNIKYFVRFCRKMAKELKNFKYVIIINEPSVFAVQSYIKGNWPPQKRNIFKGIRVYQNLKYAHTSVYKAIKKVNPDLKIGLAKNMAYFEPKNDRIVNKLFCEVYKYFSNDDFVIGLYDNLDFLGVNYYFHYLVSLGRIENRGRKRSDLGWELRPASLYQVLVDAKKFEVPLIVSENGLADYRDKYRSSFIKSSVRSIDRARKSGSPVFGYLYWSLIDNFEWDKGYWPRFGLVKIDYNSKKRTIRKSAKEYSKIIKKFTK